MTDPPNSSIASDAGPPSATPPDVRCWVVLELMRTGYEAPLPRLLSMYDVTLTQVQTYEPIWRQQVYYTGPSLLPPDPDGSTDPAYR